MAYYLLATILVLLISNAISIMYAKKLFNNLKEKESELHSLNLLVNYNEIKLNSYKKEIKLLKNEINILKSENKVLNAKIVKINNQFKNVKNYLTDN